MNPPPFDDGEYQKFYQDERTKRALVGLNRLAKRMKIVYAVIGGLAAYLYTEKEPLDEPDIDLMIYDLKQARRYIRALGRTPGFKTHLVDDSEDAIFAHFRFEGDIQIDILTSLDEMMPRKTAKINGVEVEPVEVLVIEKMVRATRADMRVALDLLAYVDYNKAFLFQLGQQYHLTLVILKMTSFARKMARGVATKADVDAMVERLEDE